MMMFDKLKALACFLLVVATLSILSSCESDEDYINPPAIEQVNEEPALQWADMTLYTLRFSAFNTPTYSSRSLGYMGLAMYESIVHADPQYKSLAGQLPGLELPTPESNQSYHWIISLNAAQHTLLKKLYPVPANSHRLIHEKIDALAESIYQTNAKNIAPDVLERSVEYGNAVAEAIYTWSLDDGGHEGYTRNFVPSFEFPTGDSYWIPPIRGQTISDYPLHPHWGNNRMFVTANALIETPAIIPFSTDPESEYYQLYKEVYDKDKALTEEEEEIAAWWADDPTETFSPPGHSYHLVVVAEKINDNNVLRAAEGFARVGLAVADSFIACWKIKYVYFNERPSSYIKKYIDEDWLSFWPEPPFPAFPSGHSLHSAATATVLTDLYGENFAFTDDVHEGKRRFDDWRFNNLVYPARTYTSFWDAADECAYSRLLGGIHTRQDNEVAQEVGKIVGANINALEWH
jgi:hypothetical protein